MKTPTKQRLILFPFYLLLSICCLKSQGDVITVGIHDYNGTFVGLENGRIAFQIKDGKKEDVEELASKVVSISMKEPQEAVLIKTSKTKSETVMVLGFEKPWLTFESKGRKSKIFISQIKSLSVNGVGLSGGSVGSVEFKPDPRINIKELEKRQDLSEEQKSAIDNYKNGKVQYDSFIESNGKLVQELDMAVGDRRSWILNELRSRKNQEAPIKQAYVIARNNLYKEFPELNTL